MHYKQGYFAYVRVSTVRQGQTGTSIAEQREAIRRHAAQWNLPIIKEFEEQETAAKRGRPVFSNMLKALKQGAARGVIMHKIDRSARNLKDWADLGEMIDRGIEVHFANESLDLQSRGGRLSADIQAVVAADYIRNLREETKKGFYGRIKQGLYPMPAPAGYKDAGKGQLKILDEVQAPLIRQAFELYATGDYGLPVLVEKMHSLGLRNKRGKKVTLNGLATILHNPFYAGLIRIQKTGELFAGQHPPVIPKYLYDRVQLILSGKTSEKRRRHFFLFRKQLRCGSCQATLIGELQKGHRYYRCQVRQCPQTSVREENIESAFGDALRKIRFDEYENGYLRTEIQKLYREGVEVKKAETKSLQLQLEKIKERLSKLTDAYLDGVLDREGFLETKNGLVLQEKSLQEQLENVSRNDSVVQKVEQFLELANNAYLSYKLGLPVEKREMVKTVASNFLVKEKTVSIKLYYPFHLAAERQKVSYGSPHSGVPRTLSALLSQLCVYFRKNGLLPEESTGNVMSDGARLARAA